MLLQEETLKVFALAKESRDSSLKSTGANIISYSGVIYNVDGSSDDPHQIPGSIGYNWKKLLIQYGIGTGLDDKCYVSNPLPNKKSTHPNFSVGGHMTEIPNGKVPKGGISYLMPLCKWHNSTARNSVAFSLNNDLILELSGYMESESPAMFALRLPSDKPYAALKLINGGWYPVNLLESELFNKGNKKMIIEREVAEYSILFERSSIDSSLTYKNEG